MTSHLQNGGREQVEAGREGELTSRSDCSKKFVHLSRQAPSWWCNRVEASITID